MTDSQNADRLKAAVLGYPVSHSLSPLLHQYWLNQEGIGGEYLPIEVKPDELKSKINELKESGFQGCNITLPHKEAMLDMVDEIEEMAGAIGAINTVVFQDDKIIGFNTDAFGFWENIKPHLIDAATGLSHPVVLGAGGAARAVVYALKKAGARQIHIIARSPQKAESLADITGDITISEFSDLPLHLSAASLLVNTTPLGMKGKDDANWDLTRLSKQALVTDIVYNPIETPLLKDARARGNNTIDGLGMLIYQALPGFEAWFGQRPEFELEILKQYLVQKGGLA